MLYVLLCTRYIVAIVDTEYIVSCRPHKDLAVPTTGSDYDHQLGFPRKRQASGSQSQLPRMESLWMHTRVCSFGTKIDSSTDLVELGSQGSWLLAKAPGDATVTLGNS